LRKVWQRAWLPDDGASTVGAYEDGIHRISNPGGRPAISVHLYGPRVGMFDGRDYDPRRDFVCARREDDGVMPSPRRPQMYGRHGRALGIASLVIPIQTI
jgi:hypothetical protein